MTLRVHVTDIETGATERNMVADGDYLLITVAPCYRAHVQTYPMTGTHVVTIKDHKPARLPDDVPTSPADPTEDVLARAADAALATWQTAHPADERHTVAARAAALSAWRDALAVAAPDALRALVGKLRAQAQELDASWDSDSRGFAGGLREAADMLAELEPAEVRREWATQALDPLREIETRDDEADARDHATFLRGLSDTVHVLSRSVAYGPWRSV